ncbi:unnamed protein product, partial [Nesidiocoris tenuis]
ENVVQFGGGGGRVLRGRGRQGGTASEQPLPLSVRPPHERARCHWRSATPFGRQRRRNRRPSRRRPLPPYPPRNSAACSASSVSNCDSCSTGASCTPSIPREMGDSSSTKRSKSLFQLANLSPFYRSVSVRLNLNSSQNLRKSPTQQKTLSSPSNGTFFPKLSFKKQKEPPGAVSPSDDDGGFSNWTGSVDRIAQIREIIKRRSEAIAKSQSAYALHGDTPNGCPPSAASIIPPGSPARPTTLPTVSRKNDVAWAPPSAAAASPKKQNFPFYAPPAPVVLARVVTPVFQQSSRPHSVANDIFNDQPTRLNDQQARPRSEIFNDHQRSRPNDIFNEHQTRPRLVANDLFNDHQARSRPHSAANDFNEHQTRSPRNNDGFLDQPTRPRPATGDWSASQKTPATSAASPSDSGYRSLPSAASDYQLKSTVTPSTSATILGHGPALNPQFNSLPSARRLSLPSASTSSLTGPPRPSHTFHGLPALAGGPIALTSSATSAAALNLLLQLPPPPKAPSNTPVHGAPRPLSGPAAQLDDKVGLLFDILDTQERFAKVTLDFEKF